MLAYCACMLTNLSTSPVSFIPLLLIVVKIAFWPISPLLSFHTELSLRYLYFKVGLFKGSKAEQKTG